MRPNRLLLAFTSLLIAGLAQSASATTMSTTINFDELTGATGYFDTTGLPGPVTYPSITVDGGPNAGDGSVLSGVLDGPSGYNNQQTSGNNLFATLNTMITFTFTNAVSNLSFDLINGSGQTNFSIMVDNLSGTQIDSMSGISLPDLFTTMGSPVMHISFADMGIGKVIITDTGGDPIPDFGVDTIKFDTANAAPEINPASAGSALTLLVGGLAVMMGGVRRR